MGLGERCLRELGFLSFQFIYMVSAVKAKLGVGADQFGYTGPQGKGGEKWSTAASSADVAEKNFKLGEAGATESAVWCAESKSNDTYFMKHFITRPSGSKNSASS